MLSRSEATTFSGMTNRDICCSAEEGVTAFRMLAKGELAILPGQAHWIPDSAVHMTIEFFRRCATAT